MTIESTLDPHASLSELRTAFRSARPPALSALVGDFHGSVIGPAWMRRSAPLLFRLTGMGAWCGKRFDAPESGEELLFGENRIRRNGKRVSSVPMRARIGASRVDHRPALIVTYFPEAPWPWRGVTDELRPYDDTTLVGLTFGIPGTPRGGAAFTLRELRTES